MTEKNEIFLNHFKLLLKKFKTLMAKNIFFKTQKILNIIFKEFFFEIFLLKIIGKIISLINLIYLDRNILKE